MNIDLGIPTVARRRVMFCRNVQHGNRPLFQMGNSNCTDEQQSLRAFSKSAVALDSSVFDFGKCGFAEPWTHKRRKNS